jgi:NAD(P)-dependent dehydrogenase (short-subunit alcohol dehydrogenase family)
MDLQLAGKRVFVSGSTQGIGYAIAAAFAAEGAEVVLNGRSDVDTALEPLRAAHPKASVSGIAADFADPRAVQGLIDTLGQVDVVVNNVGVFDLADITELPDSEWTRSFEINVMSGVRLSRALLPGMLEAGWGRIVFIGTESAVDVPRDMIHYGATKAAALALSNGLAKLTKGTGVTVNTVLGGPTYSDGVARTVEAIAAQQGVAPDVLRARLVRTSSLVQRFIEPEEIAAFVTFLASPQASATNGAALRVDGGVLPTTL